MQSLPFVSIIIITWNSKKYLLTCLDKLSAQIFQDFEVILVDNGSKDSAPDELQERYQNLRIHIEKLDSNYGFAVANNIGARLAHGKWLALLNADAFPEPNWLAQLLQAAQENPAFNFFTSRQIQAYSPNLLDGAGDDYHISGLAWRKYYNQSVDKFGSQQTEVFSACAAAALYSRTEFLKVGGFDEDYFSYFEDVDLSFRLRLVGGRCLYVPEAVVQHVGSASTGKASDFAFYHGHRNLVWTFFKDMPSLLFWYYLPIHMLMNIYLSFSFLLRDKRSIVLKSKIDAFRLLPAILRKRKPIQKMRSASTQDIYKVINKEIFAPHRASKARTKR
jgi:GT2 family glycosyltransferase